MKKDRAYYEFVECLKKEVQIMTKGWEVEIEVCPSGENQEVQDVLYVDIHMKNGKGIQRFPIEEMYQNLVSEKTNMIKVVDNVRSVLSTCLRASTTGILDDIDCYEKIRHHLILRPLNKDKNSEKLNDGVYYQIGDVALLLYINMGYIDDQYISCMVQKEQFAIWEKKEIEVMESAIRNTCRLFPPRIFTTFSFQHFQPKLYEFMYTMPDILKDGQRKNIFLTNVNKVNGAIAIFAPEVAKRLAELLGNDFYFGFINMDAAVIHDSSKVTVEDIRNGLRRCVTAASEDYLSGKVYFYSRTRKQFEVVG